MSEAATTESPLGSIQSRLRSLLADVEQAVERVNVAADKVFGPVSKEVSASGLSQAPTPTDVDSLLGLTQGAAQRLHGALNRLA